MKSAVIAAIVAAVVASFVGVKGSAAATGTGSGQTAMGSITINTAVPTASTFDVGTSPATTSGASDSSGVIPMPQDFYLNDLCSAYMTYFNPYPPYPDCGSNFPSGNPPPPAGWYSKLDIYTTPCVAVQFEFATPAVSNFTDYPGWSCGYTNSGPVPSTNVTDVATKSVDATLGIWPLQNCQTMMGPGPWAEACITGTTQQTFPVPNLDALVGSVATFDVLTNWCSFIAPPGFALAQYNGLGGLGCANDQNSVTTTSSTSGSIRTLASSNPFATKVQVSVRASASDCHVPKVKGVTLRTAKARLRRAHCGSPHVRYVKGKHLGRVRYQPLKVGTGRPNGYRVSLTVDR